MSRDQAGLMVVAAADASTDNEVDLLSSIEILSQSWAADPRQRSNRC